MRKFVHWLVRMTRPTVWRVAELYHFRVNKHCLAQGQHPLTVESPEYVPRTVYFNTRSGSVTVGSDTVFGEDVMVLTGKHYNAEEAHAAGVDLHYVPEGGRDIRIGRGCYIGSGAILIGPLSIGDFAVVGAGSVVTHDIPSRVFAAGAPARVVRTLNLPVEG